MIRTQAACPLFSASFGVIWPTMARLISLPSACSISNMPGMRGAHQACSSDSAQTAAGCETLRRRALASTDFCPGATPFALASFIAMIEAVVRNASIRNAASGLEAVAVTQEVEPALLGGAKRAPATPARGS